MKNQLNAPIEKDAASKGFYYSDRTFRLPVIFTTEQEMLANFDNACIYKIDLRVLVA